MSDDKTRAEADNDSGPNDLGGDNIDQIREILLGPHVRKVSSQLDKTKKDLGESIQGAVEDLNASIAELAKQLGREEKTSKSRFAELDDKFSTLDEVLHGQLAKHSAENHNSLEALRKELQRTGAKLTKEKVARAEFGDMLIELGMRLKGEASLKSIEASLKKSAASG